MVINKKNLHLSLKNSVQAEAESINLKLSHIRDRFSKAEAILGQGIDKPITETQKVIKDCFSIPQDDFTIISQCQDRLLDLKKNFNKSEIVRMGLKALSLMKDDHLLELSEQVTKVKTGKPRKYY